VAVQQIATDAFGNALGESIAGALSGASTPGSQMTAGGDDVFAQIQRHARDIAAWGARSGADNIVLADASAGNTARDFASGNTAPTFATLDKVTVTAPREWPDSGSGLSDGYGGRVTDGSGNAVLSGDIGAGAYDETGANAIANAPYQPGPARDSALSGGVEVSGLGLRLPGESSSVRLGSPDVDTMGQPLNGRSNYNAFSKLSDIITSSNGETLSLSRLYGWGTYTVPDASQRAAEINARFGADPKYELLDRVAASPLGGAAYGLANLAGASPETQRLVLDLGSAADGLLMAASAIKGQAPSFLGAQRPGVMDVESPFALTSNNYLSGFARTDKLGMGIRFEANQGLLDHYLLYEGRTATQLYVRAFDGNGNLLPDSVRLDRVGLRADGGYDLIDYKLSPNSPLTANQELHYEALRLNGGLVTGYRGVDLGLPRLTVLPPTPVQVKPGPTLRLDR
jgi:hypothetical protein